MKHPRLAVIFLLPPICVINAGNFNTNVGNHASEQGWSFFKGEPDEKKYDVVKREQNFDALGEIEVYNPLGNVVIEGWNKNYIEVIAEKNAQSQAALQEANVVIDLKEKDAKIKTKILKKKTKTTVDVKVRMPSTAKVDGIKTKSGTISVRNIGGKIDATSSSGNIAIRGANKDVDVKTKSGEVVIRYVLGSTGDADIKGGSGRVVINDAHRSVKAETSTGALYVKQATLTKEDNISLESKSGKIDLDLPEDIPVIIDAVSGKGKVNSSLDIMDRKVKQEREIRGYIGDKSQAAQISIKSKSGRIDVR